MKLQQIILTTTMAAVLTACGGGSDSNDASAGTGATTGTVIATPTGTKSMLAYTVYQPTLSTSGVNATITTNGTTVTNSIPLTPTLTATFTTSDAGASYALGGTAVAGGNIRADGNIALLCTGTTPQSGYAVVSSNLSNLTDLALARGKTFTEALCGSTGSVLTIAADGSASNNVGDNFTASQTSQIFSSAGLTGPNGGNYRGTFYSFPVGAAIRYFYVIQTDETSTNGVKKVSVGFQQ
jgi:hypothetical protein